jgi:hypothetical protein
VTTIQLSGAPSMVIAMPGTRPAITVLRKRKLGQQRWSAGAPEQVGHAHHERHRHHRRVAGRRR